MALTIYGVYHLIYRVKPSEIKQLSFNMNPVIFIFIF